MAASSSARLEKEREGRRRAPVDESRRLRDADNVATPNDVVAKWLYRTACLVPLLMTGGAVVERRRVKMVRLARRFMVVGEIQDRMVGF